MYESPRRGKDLEWKEQNPDVEYFEYGSEDDSFDESLNQEQEAERNTVVQRN
jgi:hypothetical protein